MKKHRFKIAFAVASVAPIWYWLSGGDFTVRGGEVAFTFLVTVSIFVIAASFPYE